LKETTRRLRQKWEDNIVIGINGVAWAGFNCLKIEASGGIL
jgi:hypothetical protein